MNKSLQEQSIFIEGPCGPIEALLYVPSQPFDKVAVICHPHPLYGGTMNNKVVHILAKTFQELNTATIKFNFRGVGKSAGHYANGEGEMDDLISVINWVKNEYPDCSLSLAGFSFGTYIALKTAPRYKIEHLILVAPPVENFPFNTLSIPKCPLIIVQGDKDEIVAPQKVFDWINTLSPKPTLIRMAEATHFFHGHLGELKKKLLEILQVS